MDITLITIPYWWDKSDLGSLVATILKSRPDLRSKIQIFIDDSIQPISTENVNLKLMDSTEIK